MKFRYVFAGAFLALSVLATGQAKAALFIPTYTIDSDLGTVVAGDNGVLENTFRLVYPGRYQDYNFTGTLDGKTRITFDYTLTGPDTSYLESVMGSLGASVLPPTVVTDISLDGTMGQVIITNFASVAANFISFFHAFLGEGKNVVRVTYSVSAVPLPAALPLFAAGLAGLAFAGRRKKTTQKV